MKLEELKEKWDLIIIGGGITGAGILREASRSKLATLLLEQNDFAWGTSSRSSKLVHGGLRYLKEGKIFLTYDSVRERQRLLKEAPGLIEPIDFLTPVYKNIGPPGWMLEIGLSIYDLMAFERQHKHYDIKGFTSLVPEIKTDKLCGGFKFIDAQVDDARLVLRVINEAVDFGGVALNYTQVREIIRNKNQEVTGIVVEDVESHITRTLSTRAVINATGSWAEKLHPSPMKNLHIRPLRGSHLILPSNILPLKYAVSFVHPKDNRPIFAIPWEGGILVGTTDVDYSEKLSKEPNISKEEAKYLMEGINIYFPSLKISLKDCIATIAGVRPVLSKGGNVNPSKESREHIVWIDKGLVTITGGKLTTFRKLAWDALDAVKPFLVTPRLLGKGESVFSKPAIPPSSLGISLDIWKRLSGRYGKGAINLIENSDPKDLSIIPGTNTIWAEIPFTSKNENIRHLSDLFLRRTRIGLLTDEGGLPYIDKIKGLCAKIIPWDEERWQQEINMYRELWEKNYRCVYE
ncbi:MAG: glycerol-3-phosphate dehydrogenase/oxidase [Desulfobacterales bacterium]|nr:glycerol-3-phosphate dehydrogenase/oxidase [Desulfobacterales bacterium]MBF0395530.1 glycerol-3-phosphate dehydrogenase/oxidase [Desulfobacterales bacterium]